MPTTLITADSLFAIKLEPGLEEILDTSKIEPGLEDIFDPSGKSNENEKSDIGEVGVGEENDVEGEGEINVEGEEEEEEGFSFYDANAPKVTVANITDCDIESPFMMMILFQRWKSCQKNG